MIHCQSSPRRQFLAIGLAASLWAAMQAALTAPLGVQIRRLTITQAQESDALWVDARSPSEYRQEHVAGAINLPLTQALRGDFPDQLGTTRRLILVYCDGPGCGASERVAAILSERLQRQICVLPGGLPQLRESRVKVEHNAE